VNGARGLESRTSRLTPQQGKDATITLKNGEQYTGVFSGGSFEATKTLYVIKMAKQTQSGHEQANGNSAVSAEYVGEGEEHVMSFDVQDTIDLFVQDVTTTAATTQQNGPLSPDRLSPHSLTCNLQAPQLHPL
jgi:hypothetical protein